MDLLRILLSRCAALFRRKRLDSELDEELKCHIEFAIQENLERGLSEEDARRAAVQGVRLKDALEASEQAGIY